MIGYQHFAEFYDILQKTGENPVDYSALSEYIDGLFSIYSYDKGILLDLACGTGELSIALSSLNYDVIGIDNSHDMLTVAINKNVPVSAGSSVQYLCQDMRELDLYGTIDFCVCALDSINHLTTAEDIQLVFDKISFFMNKGGLFFFDVNTIHKHKNILGYNTFIYDLPNLYCAWQNYYMGNGLLNIYLDFFAIESPAANSKSSNIRYKRYSESFSEKAYPLSELELMLKKAGFEIILRLDWMSNNPGTENNEKINYLVKKI